MFLKTSKPSLALRKREWLRDRHSESALCTCHILFMLMSLSHIHRTSKLGDAPSGNHACQVVAGTLFALNFLLRELSSTRLTTGVKHVEESAGSVSHARNSSPASEVLDVCFSTVVLRARTQGGKNIGGAMRRRLLVSHPLGFINCV